MTFLPVFVLDGSLNTFYHLKGKSVLCIYTWLLILCPFNDPVTANELLGKGEIQFGKLLL